MRGSFLLVGGGFCQPHHMATHDATAASVPFPVFVLADRTHVVEVRPHLLVGELKREACARCGVPCGKAWLLCGGKPMDELLTLADYDVGQHATLHLHMRAVGRWV